MLSQIESQTGTRNTLIYPRIFKVYIHRIVRVVNMREKPFTDLIEFTYNFTFLDCWHIRDFSFEQENLCI